MPINPHCPGQDLRNWKPEDIAEVPCPHCGASVEIWKDEPVRTCTSCRQPVPNPRIRGGCAQWCPHSKDCQIAKRVLTPPQPPTP